MAVHKKIHASVASKEFIIVNYVHAETSMKEFDNGATEDDGENQGATEDDGESQGATEDDGESQDSEAEKAIDRKNGKAKTKFVNRIRRTDKYAYLYCPTCKCNMKVNRGLHQNGKCNPRVPTVTCKLCGLKFTDKGMKTHRILHEEFPKLKLKDLTFVNIQTDRIINAPFPSFKKCKQCDVTFFSSVALRSHTCHDEEAKSCKYCREKFSDVAYKLHVPYHEYTMTSKKANSIASNKISKINEKDSELIKKYESLKQVWNILFLCRACDIVMDDYDRVVEHCQDHFCNMQSYNVTIEHCDTCDLNFVDDCHEKHKQLHVNNDINKESFKLIEYTYENLLLDSWMDIFRGLTKEQINLILSKSIYRFTRCVRMKVVTNGPTNLMLHQCGICRVIVAPNKVDEHAQNINGICEGRRKFACSHCTLTFAYIRHRDVHEELHKVRKLSAASFRIVQFHAEKQFSATVVKKNNKKDKTDSPSLKFIRCQRCGKLINKHKYKMHTKNHRYYETHRAKMNLLKSKQKPGLIVKNSKPGLIVKKVGFNFLVCKSCNLCVSRCNLKQHVCDSKLGMVECTQCSLMFRKKYIGFHYGYHMKNAFNSSKINITYFENGTILKESSAKTVQFNEEKRVDNKIAKKKILSHSKLRQKGGKSTLRAILQNNKVMVVYQCAECSICLWHKHNVPRHTCVAAGYRVKCDICGLIQHSGKKLSHLQLHEFRQFDASNLKYIKFHPRAPPSSNSRPVNTYLARKRKPLATFEETAVKRRRLNTNIDENNEGSIASGISKDSNVEEEQSENSHVDKTRVGNARKKERPFEQSRSYTDNLSNRYYKCKNCKLLFVTCTGLVEHEDVCGNNREAVENGEAVKNKEAVKCSECGLAFHASMIEKHKMLQKCYQHLAERVILVTIKQKGKSHNNHRNWLYVCATCDIYNFSISGMRYHFQKKHQTKYSLKTCKECGITSSSITFNRHVRLHHRSKTGISDLYIASVEDTNLEDALRDLPRYEDVIYVDEGLYKLDLTTDNVSDNKAPILPLDKESSSIRDDSITNDSMIDDSLTTYACRVCQLNFISGHALLSHYRRGTHNQERVSCDLCGLNFTEISLDKHRRLHHGDREINNKKETGVSNTAVDSVSSSFDNDSQNDASSIEDHPTYSENKTDTIATAKLNDELETGNVSEEDVDNKNSEGRIVTSNPNDKLENVNVFKNTENTSNTDTVNKTKDNKNGTSDLVTESKNIGTGDSVVDNSPKTNEIKPNNVSNIINIELNKNKLYKCSQCDVYYLTADDCREHTNEHTQLDPTEYIACKICDLQFCCEYLGRHMKSHREKTFCIDDLIVAEYHIEHGHVRIDTYLAVDRLKTKLVTTTTHFDTVDSTTAEGS